MRAALIVNPRAGRGRAAAAAADAVLELQSLGWTTTIHADPSPEQARASAARAAADSDVVIAVGGDGTVSNVLQPLVGTSAALGILPCGTGDDNARALGMPKASARECARVIATSPITSIDVGKAVTADGVTKWFLSVLCTGFDSNVNDRANVMSWPTGTAKYVTALLAELRTFTPRDYRVTIDGLEMVDKGMLVSVGNGPRYGGGMHICPDADLRDGQLDLTWLHAVGRPTLLKVFPRVFSGTHVTHPRVSTHRGSVIRLEAEGQTAYADGERIGLLPVEVTVAASALKVAAPLA